jgi:hypothetical protein
MSTIDLDEELKDLDIGQLRKYATLNRVALTRDMNKQDIIDAIKTKAKDRDVLKIAEVGSAPKPGFARIILHRDPTPGASNRPIYVNANGYKCTVPRDIEVDVPIKVVHVLNDAKEQRKELDPDASMDERGGRRERTVWVHSYPFQLLAMTPGEDPRPSSSLKAKQAAYGPRVAFRDRFGRWPKRAELLEAIKDGLIKLNAGEQVAPKEFDKE